MTDLTGKHGSDKVGMTGKMGLDTVKLTRERKKIGCGRTDRKNEKTKVEMTGTNDVDKLK